MNSITNSQSNRLPRAIAKEKGGIVMYWVEDLREGGLHVAAIARLLDCHKGQILRVAEAVTFLPQLEAEIVTEGGLKAVTLYTGESIARILRAVARSGIKDQAIKDRADDIRDQLAAAGFKLAVMLELAPQQLLAQVEAAQLPTLRPDLLAVEVSESIVKISNNLHNNPRLAQILIDSAMNAIIDTKALPAQEFPGDKWFGLVQIAEKMGIKTDASTRIKLGQFVSKHYNLERVREQRLCNGQQADIWCYRDDEATRKAIAEWFDSSRQENIGFAK
jgi:hypothetical protein